MAKTEKTVDIVEKFLRELDASNVIAAETFETLYDTGGDELKKRQNLIRLRQRAAALNVKVADFDTCRKGFEINQRNAKAKHKPESQKDDNVLDHDSNPYMHNKEISDKEFYDFFIKKYPELHCIRGLFYSLTGEVPRKKLEAVIQKEIALCYQHNTAKKVKSLADFIENATYMDPPVPEANRVNVRNGTIYIDKDYKRRFASGNIHFCLNRIDTPYDPNAAKPEKWLTFLSELLEQEDVKTLQQYLGYCLIPTTAAQKMLFIIGEGGCGKSVIGKVAKRLFGLTNIATGKLGDLEENQFQAANLENKLLFVDDDLKTACCKESAIVKELVTCDGHMLLERKGVQAYQGTMYCRLLAFGNQSFNTLHDHSEGAYRRRIILNTKPKPADRKDDKFLVEKICKDERPGILNWILDGLYQLQKADYEFSISRQAKANLEQSKKEDFNIIAFLHDNSVIQLGDARSCEQTSEVYLNYEVWCSNNAEIPIAKHTFSTYLKQHALELQISYKENIFKKGIRARGYFGMKLMKTYENMQSFIQHT